MKFKVNDIVRVKQDNNYNYGIIRNVNAEIKKYYIYFPNDKCEAYINESYICTNDNLEDEIKKLRFENEKLKIKLQKLRLIVHDQDRTIFELASKKKSFFDFFKKSDN